MDYDPTRKMNKYNKITCTEADGTVTRTFAPVPYNINITLYCLTKTQEDALQIVEQILPFFSPEVTMSINAVPESNIILDIPVVLNSVSVDDEYDGDFETRRFVTYTMNFTLKANLYGPVSESNVITKVFVNTDYVNFIAEGDPDTGSKSITIQELF
jgi:hypothetical protein